MEQRLHRCQQNIGLLTKQMEIENSEENDF